MSELDRAGTMRVDAEGRNALGVKLTRKPRRLSDYFFGDTGPVQHREDGLYTPTITMVNGDRSVQLAGVVHVADTAYWLNWERELLAHVASGKEVQMELVRSEKNPNGVVPKPFRFLGKGLRTWIKANGLTLQTDIIKPHIDKFTITDTTMERLIKDLGDDVLYIMAASTFAYPMIAVLSMVKRSLVPELLVKSLGETEKLWMDFEKLTAEKKPIPDKMYRKLHRNNIIITKRNKIAVAALNGAEAGALAMWGAAHLPGISEELWDLGWTPTEVTWRRAISTV